MRFKEAQADPGRNSQGFSMFFEMPDVPHKRPVSRPSKRSAPTYYLCRLPATLPADRRQNEETPRGDPRRFQSGKPPAVKSPRRTCGPSREVSF